MRHSGDGIDVFKVGPTLTKIRSFDFPPLSEATIGSFSPTTHRVSIPSRNKLRVFDIQNSKLLLDSTGFCNSFSNCFSSDGSLLAAYHEMSVHIWKYASGCYTLWREFQFGDMSTPLQFSPTLSSILGCCENILQVWRLHELPTTPKTYYHQLMGLSRSGTHVATAHKLENTVTITDLVAQSPPQFIDTDVEIDELFLTGNVLLVAGSGEIVAWLLTEEGLVNGAIGDRRVDRSDSIWTTSRSCSWMPWVKGQVGFIRIHEDALHSYHTETGEVLHIAQEPQRESWYRYYNNIPHCNAPPKDSWQTSRDTLREGWVKDPEGKHRMWVPVEWRTGWDPAEWHHDAMTQFSRLGDRSILIKF